MGLDQDNIVIRKGNSQEEAILRRQAEQQKRDAQRCIRALGTALSLEPQIPLYLDQFVTTDSNNESQQSLPTLSPTSEPVNPSSSGKDEEEVDEVRVDIPEGSLIDFDDSPVAKQAPVDVVPARSSKQQSRVIKKTSPTRASQSSFSRQTDYNLVRQLAPIARKAVEQGNLSVLKATLGPGLMVNTHDHLQKLHSYRLDYDAKRPQLDFYERLKYLLDCHIAWLVFDHLFSDENDNNQEKANKARVAKQFWKGYQINGERIGVAIHTWINGPDVNLWNQHNKEEFIIKKEGVSKVYYLNVAGEQKYVGKYLLDPDFQENEEYLTMRDAYQAMVQSLYEGSFEEGALPTVLDYVKALNAPENKSLHDYIVKIYLVLRQDKERRSFSFDLVPEEQSVLMELLETRYAEVPSTRLVSHKTLKGLHHHPLFQDMAAVPKDMSSEERDAILDEIRSNVVSTLENGIRPTTHSYEITLALYEKIKTLLLTLHQIEKNVEQEDEAYTRSLQETILNFKRNTRELLQNDNGSGLVQELQTVLNNRLGGDSSFLGVQSYQTEGGDATQVLVDSNIGEQSVGSIARIAQQTNLLEFALQQYNQMTDKARKDFFPIIKFLVRRCDECTEAIAALITDKAVLKLFSEQQLVSDLDQELVRSVARRAITGPKGQFIAALAWLGSSRFKGYEEARVKQAAAYMLALTQSASTNKELDAALTDAVRASVQSDQSLVQSAGSWWGRMLYQFFVEGVRTDVIPRRSVRQLEGNAVRMLPGPHQNDEEMGGVFYSGANESTALIGSGASTNASYSGGGCPGYTRIPT